MADQYKQQLMCTAGIGGLKCSCCSDGAGTVASKRRTRNRKKQNQLARRRLKRESEKETIEETEQ